MNSLYLALLGSIGHLFSIRFCLHPLHPEKSVGWNHFNKTRTQTNTAWWKWWYHVLARWCQQWNGNNWSFTNPRRVCWLSPSRFFSASHIFPSFFSHPACLPMTEFELQLCPHVLRTPLVRNHTSPELHLSTHVSPTCKIRTSGQNRNEEKTSVRMVRQKESPHKCSKVVTAKRQQKVEGTWMCFIQESPWNDQWSHVTRKNKKAVIERTWQDGRSASWCRRKNTNSEKLWPNCVLSSFGKHGEDQIQWNCERKWLDVLCQDKRE